jgi:hypothetical protein
VRDHILNEIRRLAAASGGRPPGRRVFAKETGIRESAWFGVYWARWGDALVEAGFAANVPQARLDENHVCAKLAAACRHFGRFPASMEMRLYKKLDVDFPNEKSILSAFGGVTGEQGRLAEWSRNTPSYEDVAAMIPAPSAEAFTPPIPSVRDSSI